MFRPAVDVAEVREVMYHSLVSRYVGALVEGVRGIVANGGTRGLRTRVVSKAARNKLVYRKRTVTRFFGGFVVL